MTINQLEKYWNSISKLHSTVYRNEHGASYIDLAHPGWDFLRMHKVNIYVPFICCKRTVVLW